MKILRNIFIILAAALVIVGATMALVGNSGSATSFDTVERNSVVQEQPIESTVAADSEQSSATTDTANTLSSPQFSDRPQGEGHNSASLFGIISVIQNLAIIGVIIALVNFVPHLLQRYKLFAAPTQQQAE